MFHHRLPYSLQPALAVSVVLIEHGDVRFAMSDRPADQFRGFIRVARADIENVMVDGRPQLVGAAEGSEERYLRLRDERHDRVARGRAAIAEQGENLVLFD